MMTDDPKDVVQFDDVVSLALAEAAASADSPRPEVKQRLLTRMTEGEALVPAGFSFQFAARRQWLPHPVPGIKMQVLALNRKTGYAMLLIDAAPGTRFPPHHHGGAEECYVLSGTVYTCGKRITAGDFLHADGDTDHGELFTPDGAQVILVVPSEDELPPPPNA
jgi:anti-sigma factor ChrR (cupin superfamily)